MIGYLTLGTNDIERARKFYDGVFGPGHNSFVKSPDGREDWIVYHAIDVARPRQRARRAAGLARGELPRRERAAARTARPRRRRRSGVVGGGRGRAA